MIGVVKARLHQGYRTMRYPDGPAPELPLRFLGRPVLDCARCTPGCQACIDACPTKAITADPNREDGRASCRLDMGLCIFCGACRDACPRHALTFTKDHRLAAVRRNDLMVGQESSPCDVAGGESVRSLFGRSLKLRQVSAGGCNACEADTNVLNTLAWDLGRFGIQFVASPRHADGLLITGPVPENMREALRKTYEAVPAPKIVIAVGACAVSGGLFADHPETHKGADSLVPVDLFIPGCPPHPLTILDGLLRFLRKANASVTDPS